MRSCLLQRLRSGPGLAALLVLCVVFARGQTRQPAISPRATESPSAGSIRGRVVLPNGASLNESARIRLETIRGVKDSVFTDSQGQFQFTRLNPGNYQVVIEVDGNRFETATQEVEVRGGMPSILTIALKEKKASDESKYAEKSVSMAELDTAIPAKARKEFDLATNAGKERKFEEAIAHLRRAIALYPGYLMAHNDLGAQLLAQGKLDEAEEELRRAVDLGPKAFNPHLNLGIVLVRQERFSEAADILRKALSLESNSPSVRLYSGLALQGLNDLTGAERELKAAHDLGGAAYALALFHLGQIYMNQGKRERAVEMFESYLREAPGAANTAQVKKLIGMLRR